MTNSLNEKFGELLIIIGKRISENPTFINELEAFLKKENQKLDVYSINMKKINDIDLFSLIEEVSEDEIYDILSEFNTKELREILKKYHFGSSGKLRTETQLRDYIINQLTQRKIDVFKVQEV